MAIYIISWNMQGAGSSTDKLAKWKDFFKFYIDPLFSSHPTLNQILVFLCEAGNPFQSNLLGAPIKFTENKLIEHNIISKNSYLVKGCHYLYARSRGVSANPRCSLAMMEVRKPKSKSVLKTIGLKEVIELPGDDISEYARPYLWAQFNKKKIVGLHLTANRYSARHELEAIVDDLNNSDNYSCLIVGDINIPLSCNKPPSPPYPIGGSPILFPKHPPSPGYANPQLSNLAPYDGVIPVKKKQPIDTLPKTAKMCSDVGFQFLSSGYLTQQSGNQLDWGLISYKNPTSKAYIIGGRSYKHPIPPASPNKVWPIFPLYQFPNMGLANSLSDHAVLLYLI